MELTDFGMCDRCNLSLGEPRADHSGRALCDTCLVHVDEVGSCAISLAQTLMEWGRIQEWSKKDNEVIIEALQLSTWLFEERVKSDRPLADGPRLLGTSQINGELVITVGIDKSIVWEETFGSWELGHDRVIFMTAFHGEGRLEESLTIFYWDRKEDSYKERTFWSADDEVVSEFNRFYREAPKGVPRTRLVTTSLRDEHFDKAGRDVAGLASSLGLYPWRSSYDRSAGTVTTELIGDLSEDRRKHLANLIPRLIGEPDVEVKFLPEGFDD